MGERQVEGIDHEPLNLGSPGASARAEYDRRRRRDDRRRQQTFGRVLAPVVKAITGERSTTTAWGRGGQGEERVGAYLSRTVGHRGLVLHDRAVPGSRSNIDHIAVVPSGVWVIDTKQYHGRVQRRELGGWFVPHPALVVNGRNQTKLVPAVRRQLARVEGSLSAAVPRHAVLCFTEAEWGLWGKPFTIDSVLITWANRLGRSLTRAGPLDRRDIETVAGLIAAAFPAYAPPGTSHRPTGAWPNG
jgi:hypothetical protein